MDIDKSRCININGQEYYLYEYRTKLDNPCMLCELSEECDKLADDLNKIDYQLCLQVKDQKFVLNNNNIYFKKIC